MEFSASTEEESVIFVGEGGTFSSAKQAREWAQNI